MSLRVIAFLLVIVVAVLAFVAWPKKKAEAPGVMPPSGQTSGEAGAPGMPPTADLSSGIQSVDPGLKWVVPKHWAEQPERPMRVATYSIPATNGDSEGAECAVFHFGPNQGGGVDANIERWTGQFENPTTPVRSTSRVHGFEVTRVKIFGTYLAPSGPAMESQGRKANSLLLGAIAAGPKGLVFFKFTGPRKTVEAASGDFDRMIASLEAR